MNFRLAAEEIGVTHGAVAQHVRGLEALLKIKLFDRLPRGLALTEDGRKYHAPLERAFSIIAEATNEIRPQQAVVTISVTPSFATKWLVPRLAAFTREYPELDVRIVASQHLADFKSDGVDIAVRQGKPPFGSDLTAELLYPLDVYAVCSPTLQSGEHPINKPADITHHVLLHDAHAYWPLFMEMVFGGTPDAPSRAINFSQTSLAIDAAIAGQGVALASDPFVEDDLAAGRLCRPLDVVIQEEVGFYVVTPTKQKNSKHVKLMRNWLVSQSKVLEQRFL